MAKLLDKNRSVPRQHIDFGGQKVGHLPFHNGDTHLRYGCLREDLQKISHEGVAEVPCWWLLPTSRFIPEQDTSIVAEVES